MINYYLAIDIGASGGRHILGYLQDGKLQTEEIYRFSNQMKETDGFLCWDTESLFEQILIGMKKCGEIGKIPVSVGIDTWAVDFVLLDKEGKKVGPAVAYRDKRTEGMDEAVYAKISEEELYERTGIQKQIFNTIYQLMWVKEKAPKFMEQAESLLMIPDYFHYLLSGVKKQEYTNATTTQLVSAKTGDWDHELIRVLGLKDDLFGTLSMPGSVVGELTPQVAETVGYQCKVVLPPTHDTACAVLAVPAKAEHFLYISSGTWSLMGTEQLLPDCSKNARKHNFTNEGGMEKRYRYLKNIMGLWMIQSIRKEWQQQGESYGYDEICKRAALESISSVVDCNDGRFLAPKSMSREVQAYCKETGQQVPVTKWELAKVIYDSLAQCYADCASEIEECTGQKYDYIQVVGGGSNAEYLNRLTAQRTKRGVCAGPGEATAIGNICAQMISAGEIKNVEEARSCIGSSFEVKEFKG